MKRALATVILLLLATAAPAAAQELVLEATWGWFRPQDSDFRDIYGGGSAFGLQGYMDLSGGLGIWAGVDYFSKTGEIAFTEESAKIRLIPIYAGLRYRFLGGDFQPYVAGGVAYVRFREETPLGNVSDGAFGFVGQGGLILRVLPVLHLDVFGRYSSVTAQPLELEEQIGGFTMGLGLAFVF